MGVRPLDGLPKLPQNPRVQPVTLFQKGIADRPSVCHYMLKIDPPLERGGEVAPSIFGNKNPARRWSGLSQPNR